MTRETVTQADAETTAQPPAAGEEDGDATALTFPSAPPARARRSDGTFLTGPSREASMAALKRADGVRKRRHIVTATLLDCTTPEAVAAHFERMDKLIRHGSGKDAVAAFKALYALLTVPTKEPPPPTDDDGRPRAGSGDHPLHAPVIVMVEPPTR